MKKIAVYLLLICYLSTFTEVRQLIKFPNLIEHYIAHKNADKNLTLTEFFIIHYVDEQVMDSDYKQDMQLPFKTHEFSPSCIVLNVPPELPSLTIYRIAVFVNSSPVFAYSEKLYPSVFGKIWQPPKIT